MPKGSMTLLAILVPSFWRYVPTLKREDHAVRRLAPCAARLLLEPALAPSRGATSAAVLSSSSSSSEVRNLLYSRMSACAINRGGRDEDDSM